MSRILNIESLDPAAIRETFGVSLRLPPRPLFDDDMSICGEPVGHIPRLGGDFVDLFEGAALGSHLHIIWRDTAGTVFRACVSDDFGDNPSDSDIERSILLTGILDSLPLITRLNITEEQTQ